MDTFDQALLDYAIRWCTYGGGDEHIFPEFGLTPEAFYRRVLTIVERRAKLDFAAKRYLLAYCSEKIAAAALRKPRSLV
ncbi:hypothetical protein [Rhodococcus opacus]|uniref:hypothetical protein n=1 Tax=Rhodococcus opacus TaxID=37919 RepID=UPI00223670DF|nr:hypothetical protein [Rhodococcus opacus]UZG60287.1 hypothetical protein ONE62_42205 [Rhodococcus opacus]